MDTESDRAPLWQPEELAAMLAHQLAAPVREDLEKLSDDLAGRYNQFVAQQAGGSEVPLTFGQLFSSSHPPIAVLRAVKDYAKQAISNQDGAIPEELGAVLYYASISCAFLRCGQAISALDRAALSSGLNWALGQLWLEASLQALFREHLEMISVRAVS